MSHRQVMLSLVQKHGWKRGAELGVASGQLFGLLLRECPELFLVGVDLMRRPERREQARLIADSFGPSRCMLIENSTDAAAALVKPKSFDFVFIDADHRYQAVRNDIAKWLPKVKPGGMMLGHDYNRGAFPGVIRAVDEAFGSKVEVHGFNVWGVQCR